MKGTRLVKENGIHMKKSCATLSGCATLGASVPTVLNYTDNRTGFLISSSEATRDIGT